MSPAEAQFYLKFSLNDTTNIFCRLSMVYYKSDEPQQSLSII